MSHILKKLQPVLKELAEYSENLEAKLNHVKEGFRKLLEEEDIKQLPSYKLLQKSYQEFLNTDNISAKKEGTQAFSTIYDTLHMPPKMRTRSKRIDTMAKHVPLADEAEVIEEGPVAPTPAPAPAAQRYATRNAPDLEENLLDDMGPSKAKSGGRDAVPVPSTATVLPVRVPEGDTVYTVEIGGTQYLRYGVYLYSPETHLRVGVIDKEFNIDGHRCPVKNSAVLFPVPDFDGYLHDKEGKVYSMVSESVAQAVGAMDEEGNLCLW